MPGEIPNRTLFKGPLLPIQDSSMTHKGAYSQPAYTNRELWLDRKPKEKTVKGQ